MTGGDQTTEMGQKMKDFFTGNKEIMDLAKDTIGKGKVQDEL